MIRVSVLNLLRKSLFAIHLQLERKSFKIDVKERENLLSGVICKKRLNILKYQEKGDSEIQKRASVRP